MGIMRIGVIEEIYVESVERKTLTTEECEKNKTNQCTNCGGNHLVYARVCKRWKKEEEILTVRYIKKHLFPRSMKES